MWLPRGHGGILGVTATKYKVCFRGDENVLKSTVVMAAQLCEQSKKIIKLYTLKSILYGM